MFMAGSLIILTQPRADSHSHIVYLRMSPAAFLSPLRQREREGGEKKMTVVEQTSGAAWAACRAELGDTIRTGHRGRRQTER